jgi:hypothetical protein
MVVGRRQYRRPRSFVPCVFLVRSRGEIGSFRRRTKHARSLHLPGHGLAGELRFLLRLVRSFTVGLLLIGGQQRVHEVRVPSRFTSFRAPPLSFTPTCILLCLFCSTTVRRLCVSFTLLQYISRSLPLIAVSKKAQMETQTKEAHTIGISKGFSQIMEYRSITAHE